MKRTFYLAICLLMAFVAIAQTQQGIVKTRGRMVNEQLIPGKGIPNAIVAVRGRSTILSQTNGSFSFPIPSHTFSLDSVSKNGYQLVDADALTKPYKYSTNPLYLVMETPEQQQADQLAKERNLRRVLQRRLQEREDEVENLNVSIEEKNLLLQKINKEREDNEKIIRDLSKYYSTLDYDQLDDFQRKVTSLLENSQFEKADSMLRSRGDMISRIREINKEQEAEAKEETELNQRQKDLTITKEGTQKKREIVAADCYSFYQRFLQVHQNDSAAYYIELRAKLDTTNAEWQVDAASYLDNQWFFEKAELYYLRALNLYRQLSKTDSNYEADVAEMLYLLGRLCWERGERFEEAEELAKKALEIRRRLAAVNPSKYEVTVAQTLNLLGVIYGNMRRFDDCMAMHNESLAIARRLMAEDPESYMEEVASTLNNLALLYRDNFDKSETMMKEVLEIDRQLAQRNPEKYEEGLARDLFNIGDLYEKYERFSESKKAYTEALEIFRRYAKVNPKRYGYGVVKMIMPLGECYLNTDRLAEAETVLKEGLEIRRILAKSPKEYGEGMARNLELLADLYARTHRETEYDSVCTEMLDIYRHLASENPQEYNEYLAGGLGNLAEDDILLGRFYDAEKKVRESLSIYPALYEITFSLAPALLLQGKYEEAKAIYLQYKDEIKDGFLDDLKKFNEAGVIPKEREADVEKIKQMLSE